MNIAADSSILMGDGNGVRCDYICDNTDEFAELPTDTIRPGSLALVLVNSNGKRGLYVLSNAHEWTLMAERSFE